MSHLPSATLSYCAELPSCLPSILLAFPVVNSSLPSILHPCFLYPIDYLSFLSLYVFSAPLSFTPSDFVIFPLSARCPTRLFLSLCLSLSLRRPTLSQPCLSTPITYPLPSSCASLLLGLPRLSSPVLNHSCVFVTYKLVSPDPLGLSLYLSNIPIQLSALPILPVLPSPTIFSTSVPLALIPCHIALNFTCLKTASTFVSSSPQSHYLQPCF